MCPKSFCGKSYCSILLNGSLAGFAFGMLAKVFSLNSRLNEKGLDLMINFFPSGNTTERIT